MLVLVTVEDKLTTVPQEFDRNVEEILMEKIDIKFSNKVLLEGGFCICFYDFLAIGDA